MGASASAIPYDLYKEIMHDIAPVELEGIDVTMKLANRDTISPVGILRDVEVLCGKIKYPADFLVLSSPQGDFCPIIFCRPFLNNVNAKIDCEKDVVTISLGDIAASRALHISIGKFNGNIDIFYLSRCNIMHNFLI